MDKLSGLVLDPSDDYDGGVLRSIYSTLEEVPELVKHAELLSPERRQSLPDDIFALVLEDGDTELRKFACIDAGNTALNVEYFLKVAHKLPQEAQQVGAQNLCEACGWYDLEPPETLQKLAIGVGTALNLALVGPGAVKGAKTGIRRNMQIANASGGMVNPGVLGGSTPQVG